MSDLSNKVTIKFCGLAKLQNVLTNRHFKKEIYFKFSDIQNWQLLTTLSICKVGDCGLQTYQTEMNLKRATTIEFTAISPILYIHCCVVVHFHHRPALP
jgi:hypothetical protein